MQGKELRLVFAENVLARRKEKSLRQMDVARRCGITQAYLSEIEHGKTFPTPEVLASLAEALQTSPSALLNTEGIFSPIPA